MGPVEVCKDSKELLVDVLGGGGEGGLEVVVLLGGEDELVVEERLYPDHDVVDVSRRWELDELPGLVDPGVVQVHACGHGWVVLHGDGL